MIIIIIIYAIHSMQLMKPTHPYTATGRPVSVDPCALFVPFKSIGVVRLAWQEAHIPSPHSLLSQKLHRAAVCNCGSVDHPSLSVGVVVSWQQSARHFRRLEYTEYISVDSTV